MKPQSNPFQYQVSWLRRIKKAKGRVLIVGPTGSGKTVVAATLIKAAVKAGKRVLFLAHRRELIAQCVQRLEDAGVVCVGVILAGAPADSGQPVQVASVQTLMRKTPGRFDIIIVDEAHHAAAKSYLRILQANPAAKVYGLTATPTRLDNKPLNDIFDTLVQSAPISKLIEAGAIAKPLVYSKPALDLREILNRGGDYARRPLSARVNTQELLGDLVEHYERYADKRPTVVYAVDLAHAEAITKRFRQAGHTASLLTAQTPVRQRAALLSRLSKHKLRVLVNVEVLTEGWDCKAAKCCILARPTQSETLIRQMCGRILRPDGTQPIILDHAGNFHGRALPYEDVDWVHVFKNGCSPPVKHGELQTRSKQCPECDSACGFGCRTCTFCGHIFWKRTPPIEVAGWLRRVNSTHEELKKKALKLLRKKWSHAETGATLGLSYSVISRWAKEAGIPTLPPGHAKPPKVRKAAVARIKAHEDLGVIADHYKVSIGTLIKWMSKEGITMKEHNAQRKAAKAAK